MIETKFRKRKIGIVKIGIKGHNNPQVLLLKPILIFTVYVWPMHCEIERFESLSDFLTLDLWNATLVLLGNPFFAILPTCNSRVVKLSKHLTSDQVGDTFSGHPQLKRVFLNRQKRTELMNPKLETDGVFLPARKKVLHSCQRQESRPRSKRLCMTKSCISDGQTHQVIFKIGT